VEQADRETGFGVSDVASIESAVKQLDLAWEPDDWRFHYRGIGADGKFICSIERVVAKREKDGVFWVKREGIAPSWQQAFLRAFAYWGGRVPEKLLADPIPEKRSAPQGAPKPYQRSTAPRASAFLPSTYAGPVPWKADIHPSHPPIFAPEPPEEPDWFGTPIKGKMKSKFGEILTWGEVARDEVNNPNAYDAPYGYMVWCVEKQVEKYDTEEDRMKYGKHFHTWMGKAKATMIWVEQAKKQERVPAGGFVGDVPVPDVGEDETPF